MYKFIKFFIRRRPTISDQPRPRRDWYWLLGLFVILGLLVTVVSVYLFSLLDRPPAESIEVAEPEITTLDETELNRALRFWEAREESRRTLLEGGLELPGSPAESEKFKEKLPDSEIEVEEETEIEELPEEVDSDTETDTTTETEEED